MEISERIIAAWIGAGATLLAALFQLFNSMRTPRAEPRPKKGRTARYIVAVVALMCASAAGGFMFAELRQQRTLEDMRSMRDELNTKIQSLAAATERLASARDHVELPPAAQVASAALASTSVLAPEKNRVIAEVEVPGCQPDEGCDEAHARITSVCALIPAGAAIAGAEFFLAASPGSDHGFQAVAIGQSVAGTRFVAMPAQGRHDRTRDSACADVLHWGEQPRIARAVMYYEQPSAPASTVAPAVAISTDAAPLSGSAFNLARTP